jgi:DNA recombination protein RmuC
MALERALELAGMSEGRDFDRQQVIGEENAKQRPDIVVHLPGGKHLAVDAKAPIDAFLDAINATGEDERQAKLKEFASHVRKRIKELGSKTYHQSLPDSLEFVLLYLPSEAVYRSALELESDLVEYSYGQRVFLVGPTNLMAVLLVVAEGWKQEAVTKNLAEIREHAEELYKRLKVFIGHVSDIGCHLEKSREAYNSAIGSFESRLMPHARKIEQLEAAPTDIRIGEPVTIDVPLRQLHSAEFALDPSDGELTEVDSLARPR